MENKAKLWPLLTVTYIVPTCGAETILDGFSRASKGSSQVIQKEETTKESTTVTQSSGGSGEL